MLYVLVAELSGIYLRYTMPMSCCELQTSTAKIQNAVLVCDDTGADLGGEVLGVGDPKTS